MKLHRLAGLVLLGSSALAQLPVDDRPFCTSRLPSRTTFGPGAVAAGKAFFPAGPDVYVLDGASGAWSVQRDVLSPQGASAVAAVGDRVFFAGGFSTATGIPVPDGLVHVHHAVSGTWSTEALSVPRIAIAAASTATRVYFAGGEDASFQVTDLVDVYEPATGTWSTTSLSLARSGLAGVSVGDIVLFAGGFLGGALGFSDRVDLLDTTTGTWSSASLSQPRTDLAAAAAGGRALFAGGTTGPGLPLPVADRVDVFDLASGTWSTDNLSSARTLISSASFGSRVFFVGGLVGVQPQVGTWWKLSADVDEYDAATGRWAHARLTEPAVQAGVAGLGDRVVAAGGYRAIAGSPQVSPSNLVDVFPASLPRDLCGGSAGCPCANGGLGGGGCANSVGGGARLSARRCPLVDDQRVLLSAEALPAGELALFFSGTSSVAGGAGLPFGDGLRCVGGDVRRLVSTQTGADGEVSPFWLSGGAGGWSPGDQRAFQLYYRDPAGPCGQGFNTSQAIEIEF